MGVSEMCLCLQIWGKKGGGLGGNKFGSTQTCYFYIFVGEQGLFCALYLLVDGILTMVIWLGVPGSFALSFV